MNPESVIETTAKTSGKRAKNRDWKANALAPEDWISTLMRGRHSGGTVLLRYRSGRNGAPMVAEARELEAADGMNTYQTCSELASDLYDVAKDHRLGLEGDRYDYGIRVIGDEGDTYESIWLELGADELASIAQVNWRGGDPVLTCLNIMTNFSSSLFRANIGMARANAVLVKASNEGTAAGIDAQWNAMGKIAEMMDQLQDAKKMLNEEEADAKEVEEFGKTARKWFEMAHEEKMAEKGIKAPDVPTNRKDCAIGLYDSITTKQMRELQKRLGEDKLAMLVGVLTNEDLTEEQIADLLEGFASSPEEEMKLQAVIADVFSPDYVPPSWAIWQTRAASVLINGYDGDKAD